MKPYPEYKETGLAWLPKVPSGWKMWKLRHMLKPFAEKGHPDAPLLSVVREKGVIVRDTENDEDNHNYIPDDLSGYKYVKAGQFAMNKMKAWQGSYGISNYEGIVSPAYFVFDLTAEILPKFFHVALRSKFYVPFFVRASDGIRVGQWDLSLQRMKEIPFFLPPPAEQERIVAYLDEKTAKIDRLIQLKEREIELLNEKKQAMISRVVTRGLDPNVELVDLGVDWIGQVPRGWKVSSLRRHCSSTLGKMLQSEQCDPSESFMPYLCAKDVHFSGVDVSDLKKMWFSQKDKLQYQVHKGDLLIVEGGAGAGGAALMTVEMDVYVQNSVHIVRSFSSCVDLSYVWYWLYSLVKRNYIECVSNKATIPHFTKDLVLSVPLPTPPLDEQREIVAYLDKATGKIDAAIAAIEKSIGLLKERRTRLVSDAVTGRIDLREVVA